MVIPVVPKRMFLSKFISLLSNWETQTKLCHVLALGATVKMIPLILSALITKHLCSYEQHFAEEGCMLPINQQHSWVYLMHRDTPWCKNCHSSFTTSGTRTKEGSEIQKFLGRMELVVG